MVAIYIYIPQVNPRRAYAARVTVLDLCVCVSVCLLLNISLFTCLFMPQPSQRQMKVKNFKQSFLKMLCCKARAFPVGTAT